MDTHNRDTAQSRMLSLLDHAYEVSGDLDHFDQMIEAARAYFFEPQKDDSLAAYVPLYAGLDPNLEKHIPRLEKMLASTETRTKTGLSLEQHVRLTLNLDARVIRANPHAAALFGPIEGQFLGALPFSRAAQSTLSDILRQLREPGTQVQRIIYLQTNQDPPLSVFAYCRSGMQGGERCLHINLSQFEWTETILGRLETALGLTASEGHVLRGTLMGASQKEIAAQRGRSLDTIKSQAKSVLRKAGCARMDDIVHLCTSIAYVISLSDATAPTKLSPGGDSWVTPTAHMSLLPLTDGRTAAYYQYGPPEGRPLLFIHGFGQGPFFTAEWLAGLAAHNIRLIAPCRPGFGYSSQSTGKESFDADVISDTLAILNHLGPKEPLVMAVHQGGASHGFRIASALGERVRKVILIDSGIPITQDHIRHMDPQTQLAAVASKYSPSIMALTVKMGLRIYKRKGIEAFLTKQFATSPTDLETLKDPELLAVQKAGYYFLFQQGTDSFIRDGAAAMSDWSADFFAVSCPQHWIHGAECPVMGAAFVKDFVTSHTPYAVDIIEGTGFNILHQHPSLILDAVAAAL